MVMIAEEEAEEEAETLIAEARAETRDLRRMEPIESHQNEY